MSEEFNHKLERRSVKWRGGPPPPTDKQLENKAKWERMCRYQATRMGLGFQHQVRKKVERIKEQMAKWNHSDPQYGQKLAIAIIRLSELKRSIE